MKITSICGRFVPCLLFAACLLSGCGVSEEQRQENEKNLAQAQENAREYVKEKYGFEAEVTGGEVESLRGMFGPSFSGYAYVTMQYDGKKFEVYMDGRKKYTTGVDDYQKEEILLAVQDAVREVVGQACDYGELQNHYYYEEAESMKNFAMYYGTYFDGTNLTALGEENPFTAVIRYDYAVDLSGLTQEKMQELFGANKCKVLSYKTGTSAEWYRPFEEMGDKDYQYKYALYLAEAVTFRMDDEYLYFQPKSQEYGEYYCFSESGEPGHWEKTTADDASNWNGRGAVNAEVCGEAYQVTVPDDSWMWIYYRKDGLPQDGKECRFAYSREDENGGKEYHTISPVYECGEYLAVRCRFRYDSFCLTMIHSRREK